MTSVNLEAQKAYADGSTPFDAPRPGPRPTSVPEGESWPVPVSKAEATSGDVHVDAPLGPSLPKRKRRRRLPPSNIRVVRKTAARTQARGRLPFANAEREAGFLVALKKAFASIPLPSEEVIARAVRTKNPDVYVRACRLDAFSSRLAEALTAEYLKAVVDEATARFGDRPLAKAETSLVFDVTSPHVLAWIRERAAELVRAITDDIRKSIRAVITTMYRDGIHPTNAIPLVRAALGDHELFPQWAQAVANYGTKLAADGKTPEQVQQLTRAYHDRLADQRANMIARTEIIAAQNEGRTAAWDQMVREGYLTASQVAKQWDASHEGVCPECDALDGSVVGLDEMFASGTPRPPAHPNCRCVVLLVER